MEMESDNTMSMSPDFDKPDQHGFVMMGMDTLFLDHLAMFSMTDHRYQFIARAILPTYAMRQYLADRAAHSSEVYVLGNSRYDLITLPEFFTGKRVSFVADIFRGLPEDPNATPPLIHNVSVSIARTVYFRPFDYILEYPRLQTYVLYGEGTEAHLSHFMTREPDYQQCVGLAAVPNWLPPLNLESAVTIHFPTLPYEGKTLCQNPLTAPSYPVMLHGHPVTDLSVSIGVSCYFDTSALNADEPCLKTNI
jgi:hypothetical protein